MKNPPYKQVTSEELRERLRIIDAREKAKREELDALCDFGLDDLEIPDSRPDWLRARDAARVGAELDAALDGLMDDEPDAPDVGRMAHAEADAKADETSLGKMTHDTVKVRLESAAAPLGRMAHGRRRKTLVRSRKGLKKLESYDVRGVLEVRIASLDDTPTPSDDTPNPSKPLSDDHSRRPTTPLSVLYDPTKLPRRSPLIERMFADDYDDRDLPAWKYAGPELKAFAFIKALGSSASRFTLNLGPELQAIEPKRLKKTVRDRIARAFRKANINAEVFFALEITGEGRVHLHGALSAVNTPRPVIEEALRQAGGEWGSKKGKEHQAVVEDITPKWATYCTKDASRTSKALGIANVLSVTSGLEKQGPELWEKIRRSLVS